MAARKKIAASIEKLRTNPALSLSGGERRRVEIARALRLTQGLAGVLLEQDDTVALRHLLESREALARRHEALWPAWAAGWQRLRQLSRALPYQLAWQRRHPDDALAALALADTLDAQQRHEEARRLRQQVQHRASAYIDAERPERRRQLEDALLALELQKQPPDPAARRLRARLLAGPVPLRD